ncbi:serine/threonine-protein kinase [Polyangium sorediatum]|uniref:Serine/threonine-protein kinase n=1 Tax=Polyangium sorediatum TaxID=889274 RepID=A0ABT6NXL2_9BACT|nr:serine/threonine-protein kinase [Polyangium sorediatum]MDI1433036.1 serine/threonine-protein kinase [Polyangium sorediatum]
MEGETLEGRYQLGEELGRGRHGVVYRANDLQTGTEVAVKRLRTQAQDDPQLPARLFREAQSLASLWGTSVVRVHAFGTDPDGALFLVTELLEGESFEAHLADLELFGDRLSSYNLLTLLDPIARALHTAHAQGIIHRDVKPANLFLISPEQGGGVRILDFGLAQVLGFEALTADVTQGGSPSYVAPEAFRGEPLDHRADVYAFGAVVFRALAGRTPFQGDTLADLSLAVTTAPRPELSPLRPDLAPEIDAWAARALAADPNQRYAYIPTLWNELIRVMMNGKGPSADRVRQTFRLPG